MYKEAFDALSALKSFSPDRIMVDFDIALWNALSSTFQSTQVHKWTDAPSTIYNFIAAVQMEQSSTDGMISAYMIGGQPPKRMKANEDKDRRILSIVQNYHIYDDEVLTYIDLLKSDM